LYNSVLMVSVAPVLTQEKKPSWQWGEAQEVPFSAFFACLSHTTGTEEKIVPKLVHDAEVKTFEAEMGIVKLYHFQIRTSSMTARNLSLSPRKSSFEFEVSLFPM
jgi:hypothetical protein